MERQQDCKLNEGVNPPNMDITVVHRSTGRDDHILGTSRSCRRNGRSGWCGRLGELACQGKGKQAVAGMVAPPDAGAESAPFEKQISFGTDQNAAVNSSNLSCSVTRRCCRVK